MYCPKPAASCQSILAAWVRDGGSPRWEAFAGGKLISAFQARVALHAFLRRLGDEVGRVALVPSYHCGSEIDPLARLGWALRPYDVREDTSINLADLAEKLTGDVGIVYVTHYFGWPQDIGAIREVMRESGALLIEDCALALFSRDRDIPLGTSGDASVFSLTKSLPVPDGGVVVDRTGQPGLKLPRPAPRAKVLRESARLAERDVASRVEDVPGLRWIAGRAKRRWAAAWNEQDASTSSLDDSLPGSLKIQDRFIDRRMSRVTAGMLQRIEPEAIVSRRRANYAALLEALGSWGLEHAVFRDLPVGVCPSHLAVRTERRDELVGWLRSRGIAATPWWAGIHEAMRGLMSDAAARLKRQVVALPVHQGLGEGHMAFVGEAVSRFAAGVGSSDGRRSRENSAGANGRVASEA